MRVGVVLVNSGMTNSFIGSSVMGGPVFFPGGRAALVLHAAAYGGTVFLACQAANGAWINVNGTTYSANQVTAYDLPAGQYQLVNGGSSTLQVSAALVSIPYGG